MNKLENISRNVRKMRLHYGMSQSMLAEECGISIDTIANIENNRRYPSIDLLITLAEVLHTDVNSLLEEPKPLTTESFSKEVAHILNQSANSAEMMMFIEELSLLVVKHFGA